MNRKPFNTLNDFFVRYFFTDKGGEKVLLDFINAVMISADMKTFKAVEILNPFNLKKHYKDKETIVDVKYYEKWNSRYYRSSIIRQFKISRKNTLLLGVEL